MGNKLKPKPDDSNQFKLVKNGDKQQIKTIEKAIEYGWMVLYYDVSEKLDNNIDMLLVQKSNNIGSTSDRVEYRFNERDLIMHPDFKMYVCTKISNPHYLPETFIKSTVINFLVTSEGLEEDLLTKTVIVLRPEDEELRSNLIEKIAKNDEILSDIESKILDQLLDTQTKED
jgi:dynein heavy chain